mmetsp:Transcript_118082/g.220736  ORF Transcript_118082/g.220736 Transcript_118082/m.220736 type:complete len:503 (+) Transcript_118082:71-1579(+)
MAEKPMEKPLVAKKKIRKSSMAPRKASINVRWTGGNPVDLTEEFAVKNAMVNTMSRRATAFDMKDEGFTGLAAVQGAMESVFEATIAGKTDEKNDMFDDNPELMTNGQAMLNLLNNCLGSALLSIGYAVSKLGVIGGAVTIVFAALINRYTCMMSMETSKIAQQDPATTAATEMALGKPGKVVQLVVFFGIGFSCMVSYLTASTDAVVAFLKLAEIEINEKIVTVLVWFFLNFPPSLIRSLQSMATFSMIAFIGSIFMVGAIIGCSGIKIASDGINWENIDMFPTSIANFMSGFPTIIMIFGIQAGTGPILGGMKDSSDENIQRQTNRIFTFVIFLFMGIGLTVYLAYDKSTNSDVLKVLPEKDAVGIIARLGALVLVVLSYMIMMVPCKLAVIESVFGKNEALMEATLVQYYGTTIGLNIVCLCVALVVSDLSIIFAFMSAFISPVLSWWLPCGAMIGILALPDIEGRPKCSIKNLPFWLVILFGVSLCGMGTKTLVEMFI